MKNAPIIISIIALIGVILLFVNKMSKNNNETVENNEVSGTNKIAFVNMDTLVGAYNYYNDLQTDLYKVQNQKETELDSRYKALQRKAYDVQNQVKNQMMTPTKGQKMQQQLGIEEQKIMQDKQTYELQLQEQGQKINLEILDSIRNYLQIYNKDKHYSLILANDTLGRTVLLSKNKMDITKDIVSSLNLRYNSKPKAEIK